MKQQNREIPFFSRNKVETKKEHKVFKRIILWTFRNLKFLFIPGSHLQEMDRFQREYKLIQTQKRGLKRLKSPLFIIGLVIILFLATIAVFPDWISPLTYYETIMYTGMQMYAESFFPPSPEHPLGQTFVGFDVLGRIIYGTRPVLVFALSSTFLSLIFGIIIGAFSGYFEGWFDAIVMRLMDIILSFPGVVFAIVFITIWGSGFTKLVFIYSLIGTPYFARLVRTNVLKEKELPYIASGRVSGAKNLRIIFKHILPNCLLSLIVAASFNIGRNILSVAVLGFLRHGGIQWIEWGLDIARSINNFYRAPWAVLYPSLMISISVIGFLLVGDGLSDVNLIRQESL